MKNFLPGALLCAFFILTVASIFGQGSLTPPGPPAATMKSLDQIASQGIALNSTNTPGDANNHFVIAQPGSYYLTGNLAVAETNAIRVAAAGVTIDLNGFQISHASGTGGDGITILTASHSCTIKNGAIIGFTDGIDTITTTARGCILRNITAANCTGIAIRAGEGTILERCSAHDNSGAAGIATGTGATLISCTAAGNSVTNGIQAGAGSSLINCTASSNTGTNGISAGDGCSLSNCTSRANTLSGNAISAGTGCALSNCAAESNTATNGISAAGLSSLINCTAVLNTSNAATSTGISGGQGCTISNCTASANLSTAGTLTNSTGIGFNVADGSTVQDSTANNNQGDGIRVSTACRVTGNTCRQNGGGGDGAGIHTTSFANRIERNHVFNNTRGIDVGSSNNLIIGNSATANITDYSIAANNRYGAIVDIRASGTAAVSGTSAASTLTSTDPWANFSH